MSDKSEVCSPIITYKLPTTYVSGLNKNINFKVIPNLISPRVGGESNSLGDALYAFAL